MTACWLADGLLVGSVNIFWHNWTEDTITKHTDGTIRQIVIQDPKVNQYVWNLGCQNDIFNIRRFNDVVYHRNWKGPTLKPVFCTNTKYGTSEQD